MKTIIMAALIAVYIGTAQAAQDASALLQNSVILAPTGTQPERLTAALVASQAFTTNATATSGGKAASGYFGKGNVLLTFSGNADAAYTNVATIAQGPSAGSLTNTITTIAHGGDTIAIESYEIDFDALTQAYWGVTFAAETDNAAAYRFAADVIYDGVPSAAQTITSDAYDKMPLTGIANVVVTVGTPKKGATNFVATVQLQSASTSGGSYTNVTGALATITGASGGSDTIAWDTTGGKRYIKAVYTTTNDVADVAITVNSFK
jgi:hypothetical protein